MTIEIAAVKTTLRKLVSGDYMVTRAMLRVAAKGVFLAMLALMIVTYAVSVSQSVAPAPQPLPERIYS